LVNVAALLVVFDTTVLRGPDDIATVVDVDLKLLKLLVEDGL
jgi:hypothetical protein